MGTSFKHRNSFVQQLLSGYSNNTTTTQIKDDDKNGDSHDEEVEAWLFRKSSLQEGPKFKSTDNSTKRNSLLFDLENDQVNAEAKLKREQERRRKLLKKK